MVLWLILIFFFMPRNIIQVFVQKISFDTIFNPYIFNEWNLWCHQHIVKLGQSTVIGQIFVIQTSSANQNKILPISTQQQWH